MNQWQRDVRNFHLAIDAPVGKYPRIPTSTMVRDLRMNLIVEETDETLAALMEGDLPAIADGIADSIVVLLGTAVAYGIDMEPVWKEVHASNMDKLRGPKRADGKQLKPEGWEPPDIDQIIQDQIDQAAERQFTQRINPDPVTDMSKELKQKSLSGT